MYFKQIDEIISGTKTQTRRVCKSNEFLHGGPFEVDGKQYVSPVSVYMGSIPNERLKWQVGRDYAVSPGRGKPGVWWNHATGEYALPYTTKKYKFDGRQRLKHEMQEDGWQPLRIVLTDIRREPLQAISEADALAEGWPADEDVRECPYCDALYPTGEYYGPDLPCLCNPVTWYRELWESINGRGSWGVNPDVWVLTFQVAR